MNTNLIGIVISLLSTNYLRTDLHSVPCQLCPEPHEFELVTVRQVVRSNQVTVLRDGMPELIELDDVRPLHEIRVTNHVFLARWHLSQGVWTNNGVVSMPLTNHGTASQIFHLPSRQERQVRKLNQEINPAADPAEEITALDDHIDQAEQR